MFSQLSKDWRFTVTCVSCLAIGMTAIATVFSLANEVLLKPLPFVEPERLVMIRSANYANGRLNEQLALPDFLDYRDQCESFENLAGYRMERLDFPLDHGFERAIGFYITDNFFDVLRVKPFLGSGFDDQAQRGNLRNMMLGTSLWRRRFHANPEIVGKTIPINTWIHWPKVGSTGFTVGGLLPEGMQYLPCSSWFKRGGVRVDSELPFCLPMEETRTSDRDYREVEAIGRLKPDVTLEQAQAELKMVADRLAKQFPDTNTNWTVRVVPLHQHVFGQVESFLKGLFWASLLILTIGCGNAMHLMLVRFTNRLSCFAIQASLGATPMRLARQILWESLVYVVIAFVVSIGLTLWSVSMLSKLAPPETPRLDTVVVDWRTFVFAAGVSGICLLAVVLLPLQKLLTANLNRFLNMAGSTASQGLGAVRLMRHLIVAEIAISYVLLVVATWGILKMYSESKSGLGFEPKNRLTMTISLPQAKHEWLQNTLFCHEVMRKTRELPGVIEAAAIAGLPVGGNQFDCYIVAEGRPDLRPDDLPDGFLRVITDEYFKTMQIPLIYGRIFNASDAIGEIGGNRTVIINKTLADRCWPGQNPVGRRMKPFEQISWLEVVGVVGDVKGFESTSEPTSDMYYPERLFPQPSISLIVHVDAAPMSFVSSVRRVIQETDADAHITQIKSMDQVVKESQATQRYALALVTGLATAGFALAVLGVFCTTSYTVSKRRQELTTRIACGATPANIISLIIRGSMALTFLGLAFGLTIIFWILTKQYVVRVHSDQLVLTLATTSIPLIVASVLASLVSASRFAFSTTSRQAYASLGLDSCKNDRV